MRRLSIALLSSTCFLATSPGFAQQVDQAGAEALEAQVPAFIDSVLDNASTRNLSYSFASDVTAVPQGDSYALTIPEISFAGGDDVVGSTQTIEALVTPLANGWQRAQFDIPSPIRLQNPDNADENATFSFSSVGNDLTFAPQYNMATNGDVSLNDLLIEVSGADGQIAMDAMKLQIVSNPTGSASDTFDSSSAFDMSGLSMRIDDEFSLDLTGLGIVGTTARQRFDLFAEFQDVMRGVDPESEEFQLAIIDLARRHEGEKWLGDADYTFSLDGFSFASDDATFAIDGLSVSLVAAGLDQSAADLGFMVNAAGLQSPDLPPPLAPVIPTQVSLDVLAVDAPIEAVTQELYGFLGDAPSEEELFGPKGRRAGVSVSSATLEDIDPMVFLGLLMTSDVAVQIRDLLVEAPIGYVAGNGVIEPDPAAALQATASIDLQIAGLPEMIAFAQQMGGDAAQFAGLASAVSAMGRDSTDANGVPIKAFDLELTAQGQMLLNGNDMSAMLGMFQ